MFLIRSVDQEPFLMTFNPGDQVSVKGFAIPMTVQSVNGDDVTVLEYDPKRKMTRERTCKAATLQPAPRRRGAIRFVLR
ncbi:MAG: hypothetical protein E7812_09050 [Phenylobacterium sp.]|nr:MAG: hypothetical protein E7812_09050 [Phenylobacterium sp.]